jgi:murein L,D-transpeptidase YcbB/YkuD
MGEARRLVACLALTAVGTVAACNTSQESPPVVRGQTASSSAGVTKPSDDSIRAAIAVRLATDLRPLAVDSAMWRTVQRVYDAGEDAPIWVPGARLGPRAVALGDVFEQLPDEGLRLKEYPLSLVRKSLVRLAAKRSDTERLAEADIALTAAYVALGTDLLTGQIDPHTVTTRWHIEAPAPNVAAVLIDALEAPTFDGTLNRLRPQGTGYDMLRHSLARYRSLAERSWPGFPLPGPTTLHPNDTTDLTRIAPLRARLRALAYADQAASVPPMDDTLASGELHAVYDSTLAAEVADYQARHGLTPDSVLGVNTLTSLNRPIAARAQQTAANLERLRWLPRELGTRFLLVNVPAFRLTAYDSSAEALSMKVVVGAEYDARTTPVFSDSMTYVVFRPYWNVPERIAANELWPKEREDSTFFARNGYERVNASWGSYVRQRPGDTNALGLVKFIFPNDFHVYLHDTPETALFSQTVRAFSHGCIRVERPDALAAYVLGWPLDSVHDAMQSGPNNHRANLDRKLPVYIAYFTAYAHGDAVRFARDIYDRDGPLIRAMDGAVLPADAELRAAREIRRVAHELVGLADGA